MLIDFHTHVFPDKLVPRAIEGLMKNAHIVPYSYGSVEELLKKMDLWGVDRSVVLNIATNPKQQNNVNEFSQYINNTYGEKLISFGSVNPYSENPVNDVFDLKNKGMKGIKLHPDYVGLMLDDKKCMNVLSAAQDAEMIVVVHAGYDFISPNIIHATPDRILNVIKQLPKLKLVAAHLGSNKMWRDVLKKLCGKNVYFDTALCAYEIDRELAEAIINNHDPEKILFGSDMPWCSPLLTRMFIEELDISSEIKEKIYYKNALKLLGET